MSSTRRDILAELRKRVETALPTASVRVGELQDLGRSPSGTDKRQVVSIIPAEDVSAEGPTPELWREWTVELHLTFEVDPADVDGWLKLEDAAWVLTKAVEQGWRRLGGLLASEMLREEIEPAPRPVGGRAMGIMMAWTLPYRPPAVEERR